MPHRHECCVGEMAFVASAKKALGVGVVLEHEQMRVCDVVAAENCQCWELDVTDFVEANNQDISSIADVMKIVSTVSDDRSDEALRLGVKSLALQTRCAWLVKKRFNIKLQKRDWRCIEVDCERKHIINKKMPLERICKECTQSRYRVGHFLQQSEAISD